MNEVWYVAGARTDGGMPTLFETKLDAERWARITFPKEDAYTRYARIYSTPVHTTDDMLGVAHKPA